MNNLSEIIKRPNVKVLTTEDLGEGAQRQIVAFNGYNFKRISKPYYPVV